MKKILVVDDDQLIHELIKAALDPDKYDVHRAYNVEEALHLFDHESFDLLLTDILMPPGNDGTKLMRYVKEKHPDMPVLAMTGGIENATDDYVHYADLFSDQTLMKPFAKADLQAMISRF